MMTLYRPVAGIFAMACMAFAQTPAPPAFDVASVKALVGETHGAAFDITPNGVNFRSSALGFLIRWAYGMHQYQNYETVGLTWMEPGLGCVWVSVVAKTDRPVPVDQLKLMLRTLLTERLKLSLHRETRDIMVYVLSVGKDGPKLHESDTELDAEPNQRGNAFSEPLDFTGTSIKRLTETMSQFVTHLIVDETGLQGGYDFTLNVFKYQDYFVPDGRAVDMGPAFNKAMEPLGLKLELKRRPVEVLVIDHVEKAPVEN